MKITCYYDETGKTLQQVLEEYIMEFYFEEQLDNGD